MALTTVSTPKYQNKLFIQSDIQPEYSDKKSMVLQCPELMREILLNAIFTSKKPLVLCSKKKLLTYLCTSKQMHAQTICLVNRWFEVHCHSLKIFGFKTAEEAISYVTAHKMVNVNLKEFYDLDDEHLAKLVKENPRLNILHLNGSKIHVLPSIHQLKKLLVLSANNKTLLSIWTSCPNLEILDITSKSITNTTFKNLNNLKLRELYIDNNQISDLGIAAIVDSFPELEYLMFKNAYRITDCSMTTFKQNKMKGIYLTCSQIGNKKLADIAMGCPKLEIIYISETQVTDIKCLSEHKIKSCDLSYTKFSDDEAASLAGWKLEVIDFSDTLITDKGMTHLNPEKLREIYFKNTKITDITLIEILSKSQNLELIDFSNNEKITDLGIQAFKNTKIRKAYLNNTKIGDKGLINFLKNNLFTKNNPFLKDNPFLESIHLNNTSISHASVKFLVKTCCNIKAISLENVNISDETICCIVENCLYLETIYLGSSNITNIALDYLTLCRKTLKDISINYNKIDDVGIEYLSACTKLEEIALGWTDVTDLGIIQLTNKCSKLRKIHNLNACQITDVGLVAIGKNCPHLAHINLINIKATVKGLIEFLLLSRNLKELIIAGWNITDEDLLEIGKVLPCLESLDLSETQVSKNGLASFLKTCPFLKTVSLTNILSIAEAQALRKLYPGLIIYS